MGSVLDEVVGPDMVRIFGTKPDAGPIGKPQTPALWLLSRNLQSLASPQPFYPLVVDLPACIPQHRGDLAIAVAPILTRKFGQIGYQAVFVFPAPRQLALCRAILAERRTGATLGDRQHLPDMVDTGPAPRGA